MCSKVWESVPSTTRWHLWNQLNFATNPNSNIVIPIPCICQSLNRILSSVASLLPLLLISLLLWLHHFTLVLIPNISAVPALPPTRTNSD